jgi:hypothetical protein
MAKDEKGMEIKLFPNPSQGNFQVQLCGSKVAQTEISITDLAGKTILQKEVTATEGIVKKNYRTESCQRDLPTSSKSRSADLHPQSDN